MKGQSCRLAQVECPVGEGFLEWAALDLTRSLRSPERPCVPGSGCRTEADGKSSMKCQVTGKNHMAMPIHFEVLIREATGSK